MRYQEKRMMVGLPSRKITLKHRTSEKMPHCWYLLIQPQKSLVTAITRMLSIQRRKVLDIEPVSSITANGICRFPVLLGENKCSCEESGREPRNTNILYRKGDTKFSNTKAGCDWQCGNRNLPRKLRETTAAFRMKRPLDNLENNLQWPNDCQMEPEVS